MNTQKGIVFETKASYSIFLTSDGLFQKGVPLDGSVQVGEDASFRPYQDVKHWNTAFKTKWSTPIFSIAATIVLLLFVLLPSQTTVSAFVQIDINPSIELGIDKKGTVYLFEGLNEDGKAIKQDISFWKGKPLSWVLLQIIDRSKSITEETEMIEITTIYQNEEGQENLERVIAHAVTTSTSQVMNKKNKVKVINASTSDREIANIEGISVQQYHAGLEVKNEKKQDRTNNYEKRNSQQKESEDIPKKSVLIEKNLKERKIPKSEDNQTHNQKGNLKSEIKSNRDKIDIKKHRNNEQTKKQIKSNEHKADDHTKQQPKEKKDKIHTKKDEKNDGNKGESRKKSTTNKDMKEQE